VQCLRGARPEALLDAEWKEEEGEQQNKQVLTKERPPGFGPISVGIMAMPFVPVVDGSFLTADPARLLRAGSFKQAGLLLGADGQEGNYFLIYYLPHLFPHNSE
jgi:hypothetical protein